MRHIYLDETQDPISGFIGVGQIRVETALHKGVVDEALSKLAGRLHGATPERTAVISKTLKRGWFHASKDGNDAREIFFAAIAKHVRASCDFAFLEPGKLSENGMSLEQGYRLLSALAPCMATKDPGPANLVFAQRQTFVQSVVESWLDGSFKNLEEGRDGNLLRAFGFDQFPYFPEGKVAVVASPRDQTGLQVIDYLLWSKNCALRQEKNHGGTYIASMQRNLFSVPMPNLGLHMEGVDIGPPLSRQQLDQQQRQQRRHASA